MNRAALRADCIIEGWNKMKLILASNSPRRQELLRQIGLDFEVIAAESEALPDENLTPDMAVAEIALQKAKDVRRQLGDTGKEEQLIIAADTMVCLKGALLGKPLDEGHAREMLAMLSDKKHTVYTGIALLQGNKQMCDTVATDVYFRKLTKEEISAYVTEGEPMDKAGAYGIQGKAAHFVSRIDGDFYNVMGLPLCRLWEMLKEMGIKPE